MPDALNPIHVLTCLMCGKLADTSAAPIPTPVAVAAAALAAATLAAALAATSVVVCALSPPPPSLGGQDFGPVPRRRPFGRRFVLQPTVGPPIQVAAATNEFSGLAAAALTTPEFAALAAATVAAAASTPPLLPPPALLPRPRSPIPLTDTTLVTIARRYRPLAAAALAVTALSPSPPCQGRSLDCVERPTPLQLGCAGERLIARLVSRSGS